MDKKNTVIGVLLLSAAFAALYLAPKPAPLPPKPAAAAASTTATISPGAVIAPTNTPAASTPSSNVVPTQVTTPIASATITTLANDYIEARFTNASGAISDIALKKYPAMRGKPEPVVFNALHADPMLALVDLPGLTRETLFELVPSQSANEVVYRAVVNGNLEIIRRYILPPNEGKNTDPYQLRHETTLRNLGEQSLPAMKIALALGTVAPANSLDKGQSTAAGYSSDGSQHFTLRTSLDSSTGFFGMGLGAHTARGPVDAAAPMTWTTVKNQFFAAILNPDEPATGLKTWRVQVKEPVPTENENDAFGIAAVTLLDVKAIAPREETKLGMNFYVGPKEYRRLANIDVFKAEQDKVMDFGMFKFFSQLLNHLMTWMHDLFTDRDSRFQWGVAIILTTLTLKIATLPLTLKASKSMKRMQKLAPEMKIIREKFKDNPQKQQVAMMELYKKHKVNPLGGCIPMLLPLPFFFGFYSMLQNTSELRMAPFLWAPDLSTPDTVGHLLGIPINILPLILGATTFMQMHLTPQVNMDKTQAAMMKFTPLIFLVICYNFSCALSLYSTVNGLFTIFQQLYINRLKDDGDPTPAINDRLKNVTPAKKKK